MNKIVSVTFGQKDNGIFAGEFQAIDFGYSKDIDGLCAVKIDIGTGREMQAMIVGPGCKITYQEVQA